LQKFPIDVHKQNGNLLSLRNPVLSENRHIA